MEKFDFICPICNTKLKVSWEFNGEICNCPSCDAEIVPVCDEEIIQQWEQQKQEQERIKQEKIAAEERIKQEKIAAEERIKKEKEAQILYQQRCEKFCSGAGEDFHKTQRGLYSLTLCEVFIYINILGGIVASVGAVASKNPYYVITAVVCVIDVFVLFAVMQILVLFQFQVQNSFRIVMLLDEISKKMKN